jgi:hypothetical protein
VLTWHANRQLRERVVVARRNPPPLRDELIQPRHLTHPESCLNVGHSIVVAQADLLIVPDFVSWSRVHLRAVTGYAVTTVALHQIRQLSITRHRHAALAGRNDLHGMEAENGNIAKAAISDWLKCCRTRDDRCVVLAADRM